MNAEWIRTHEQKDAFKEFKDAVSKAPVLNSFSKSDLTEGQQGIVQGWVWLFTDAAWSTSEI